MFHDIIKASLRQAHDCLEAFMSDARNIANVAEAGQMLAATFAAGGTAFSCGNGGSMCDAMHFAEELTGRFRENRKPFPAVAISDGSYLSCVGNDFGYDKVFARYLEAHGRSGDFLLAISTSGSSRNVIEAVQVAKAKGLKSVVLTGHSDRPLAALADLAIVTPGGKYADRVQELHIKVIHILMEIVEQELCRDESR